MISYLDIYTLIAAFGLCFGLMNDKARWLTNPLRKIKFFDKMLNCPYCTGFHCGWMVWLGRVAEAGTWPVSVSEAAHLYVGIGGNVLAALLCGFASAVFCYTLDTTTQWLEVAVIGREGN